MLWCYAAPITGVLSLGLTLSCAGLSVAGGVTNTEASLVNHSWEKSDTERSGTTATAVVNIIMKYSRNSCRLMPTLSLELESIRGQKRARNLRLCWRKPPVTMAT